MVPKGAVIVNEPVGVVQEGCVGAPTVGAAGAPGKALIVTDEAVETQLELISFTVTW